MGKYGPIITAIISAKDLQNTTTLGVGASRQENSRSATDPVKMNFIERSRKYRSTNVYTSNYLRHRTVQCGRILPVDSLARQQSSRINSVADLGFPRGGGANSPEGGHQHRILPKFPKNCMKLKEFGPRGGARPKFYYVDPPLQLVE